MGQSAEGRSTLYPLTVPVLAGAVQTMAQAMTEIDVKVWSGREWVMQVTDEQGAIIPARWFAGPRGENGRAGSSRPYVPRSDRPTPVPAEGKPACCETYADEQSHPSFRTRSRAALTPRHVISPQRSEPTKCGQARWRRVKDQALCPGLTLSYGEPFDAGERLGTGLRKPCCSGPHVALRTHALLPFQNGPADPSLAYLEPGMEDMELTRLHVIDEVPPVLVHLVLARGPTMQQLSDGPHDTPRPAEEHTRKVYHEFSIRAIGSGAPIRLGSVRSAQYSVHQGPRPARSRARA